MFVSLWAYPFIAIPYMRRRRLIMDRAAIGSDAPPKDYASAVAMVVAFQAKLRADIEASTQEPTP
jgi:hypothetical protein